MTSSQVKKIANIDLGIVTKCLVMEKSKRKSSGSDRGPSMILDKSVLSNMLTSVVARLGGICHEVEAPEFVPKAKTENKRPDAYSHKPANASFNLKLDGEISFYLLTTTRNFLGNFSRFVLKI